MADTIPRCAYCNAFFNRYNSTTYGKFVCSLCGSTNSTSTNYTVSDPEARNEVYDAITSKRYIQRTQFVPTYLFVLTLDLLKSKPFILDKILEVCMEMPKSHQFGLLILHGSVSFVQFRPQTVLLTFADGNIRTVVSKLFVGIGVFVEEIRKITPMLQSLELTDSKAENDILKFIVNSVTPYGSSVALILDENHLLSLNDPSNTDLALKTSKFGAQFSLLAFTTRLDIQTSVTDYVSITGGRFYTVNDTNFPTRLSQIVDKGCMNDVTIFIKGPETTEATDYAGPGLLKSGVRVLLTKVAVGESFFVSFDESQTKKGVFQFVVFFTNDLSVRKIRVITVMYKDCIPLDIPLTTKFISAMTAQSLLVENSNMALKVLQHYSKSFGLQENPELGQLLKGGVPYLTLIETTLRLRRGESSTNRMYMQSTEPAFV